MARDLTREARQPSRNGSDTAQIVDEALGQPELPTVDPEPTGRAVAPAAEAMSARRDWVLARIALMLIDAAKILDPITRIVMARFLSLAALGSAVGICVYTISRTEGWERVATAGLFVVLASWLIRKGQQ